MGNSGQQDVFGALFARGWQDEWLQRMLDAEAALARAAERAGLGPAGSGAAVTAAARAAHFDAAQIASQAAGPGNPVPALVRALTAAVPPEAAPAVHPGATSQDIIDTAMMLMAADVTGTILADLSAAAAGAATLASQHQATVMVGRTLLQQAVPVTFGLVAANWLAGLDRARTVLAAVRKDRLACQFGGAAGTLASLGSAGPRLAALFAAETGLAAADLPWHTERLRVLELAGALAAAGAAAGKVARDVTLLAQSEVAEVAEGGGTTTGGSSAMPHKRNPVVSVLVLGCTRRLPGLLGTVAAAAEQEHQRAAGAWHAEWETMADMLRLTGSAAALTAQLLGGLQVDAGRMRANLDAAGGLPLAEHVTALLSPALGRLPAHDLVARASRQVAQGGNLASAMMSDQECKTALDLAGVTETDLRRALDPAGYLGATQQFIAAALAAHDSMEVS